MVLLILCIASIFTKVYLLTFIRVSNCDLFVAKITVSIVALIEVFDQTVGVENMASVATQTNYFFFSPESTHADSTVKVEPFLKVNTTERHRSYFQSQPDLVSIALDFT